MRLRSSTPVICAQLDRQGHQLLHRQVYDEIRSAILAGRFVPEERIPSSRVLAKTLRVSRNTVVWAIEQLVADGYLVARPGSGTFVSSAANRALPNVVLGPVWIKSGERVPRSSGSPGVTAVGGVSTPIAKAFKPGVPDIKRFPFDTWGRLLGKVWRNPRPRMLLDDPLGYAPLRQAIATYLSAGRGVRCTAEQVIITSGIRQALSLVASTLLKPGDTVWTEDPGYPGLRSALSQAGMRVMPVPVDKEGISLVAGRSLGNDVRLIAVTPAHHYPLGTVMPISRRNEVLGWASTADAYVLEDDYDSEFVYAGSVPPPLQSLDANKRVIYTGSFSKALFPSLRLGYLVAPQELIAPLAQIHITNGNRPSVLAQPVLSAFISEGHFERHLKGMQEVYGLRQRLLVQAVRRYLSGLLEVFDDVGGTHLVAYLSERLGRKTIDTATSRLAAATGIIAPPLADFYAGPQTLQGLLLGYAALDEVEIDRSARQLAYALKDFKYRRIFL